MAHDWENDGIRIVIALIGWVLLRVVRRWDSVMARLAALERQRPANDHQGVDGEDAE